MAVTNNIIQIEEFTLTAGLTDIVYSVSGILPNALIGVYCDHYGVYPIDCKRENNSIHITYEPQETTMHVALFFLLDEMIIENNLSSDSETHALSAAQGKALKALIDNIHVTASLSDLTDVEVENLQTDDILIYDAIEEKWINAPLPSIPSDISDLDDVTITSPSNGQTLVYNNGDWINGNVTGGGGIDYSETEQDTGLKWINGETIYQKSWSIDNTNTTSWEHFNHNISNLDLLISTIGSYNSGSGTYQKYALPYYESSTGYGLIVVRPSEIYYRIGSALGSGKLTFTIRYTKSS